MKKSTDRQKVLLSLMIGALSTSACKTTKSEADGSSVKVVGGKEIASDAAQSVIPLATGCTGTLVTFGDFIKDNYVLTTTECANEIKSKTDTRSISNREAVMQEWDTKDRNHLLGLIDYHFLKSQKDNKKPNKKPALINTDSASLKVGDKITVVGYGCKNVESPNTDWDHNQYSPKRMGSNTVDTIDLKTGLMTFSGPLSGGKNSEDVSLCPRSKMPKEQTADEGAPVIWGGKIGAVALYSKVSGNKIITTAKLLSFPTSTAFLKKWLYQDRPGSTATAQTNKSSMPPAMENVFNVPNDGDVGSVTQGPADWAPNYRKGTCFAGQHIWGVHGYGNYLAIHCQSTVRNSGFYTQGWYTSTLHNNHDDLQSRTNVDWAPGERKFECKKGHFVAGIAKSNLEPTGVTAMYCATSELSKKYSGSCRSVGTREREAFCDKNSEYLAGIFLKWNGAGSKGSNHIGYLLCCRYE